MAKNKRSGGATPKKDAPVNETVEKNEPVVIAETEGLPDPAPQAEEVVVQEVKAKAKKKAKPAKKGPTPPSFIY